MSEKRRHIAIDILLAALLGDRIYDRSDFW